MKITRLNSDKEIQLDTKCLDVEVNGSTYRLTESIDGNLNISGEAGLIVYPCVSNVIEIETK